MAIRHLDQLGARHLVEHGWSDELAHELVEVSREPKIRLFTPNDHKSRFRDDASANEWYGDTNKKPEVYSLREKAHRQLAGVAWFSMQEHELVDPLFNTTFAIRLYDIARGQGLSYPFAKTAHDDFSTLAHRATGLWLETDQYNQPAQRLYEKLGYATVTAANGRIIMTRPIDITR
jgi:RimJ/RimL family protein N-acetyltransferase